MNELLVIVDMVKGFVNKSPLADNKISKITLKIIEQIKYFLSNSLPIISFRDCHSSDDDEFKISPPHCIKGTSESKLVNELLLYSKHFIDIEKTTTNGYNTELFLQFISKNIFDEINRYWLLY